MLSLPRPGEFYDGGRGIRIHRRGDPDQFPRPHPLQGHEDSQCSAPDRDRRCPGPCHRMDNVRFPGRHRAHFRDPRAADHPVRGGTGPGRGERPKAGAQGPHPGPARLPFFVRRRGGPRPLRAGHGRDPIPAAGLGAGRRQSRHRHSPGFRPERLAGDPDAVKARNGARGRAADRSRPVSPRRLRDRRAERPRNRARALPVHRGGLRRLFGSRGPVGTADRLDGEGAARLHADARVRLPALFRGR